MTAHMTWTDAHQGLMAACALVCGFLALWVVA